MTTWPTSAKIQSRAIQVIAHSRGATSVSGFLEYETGRGSRIAARVSVAPLKSQDAFAFRAFLHSLRGKGSFSFPVPTAKASGAPISASTLAASVSANASTVTVACPHTYFTVGGFITIGAQTVRVVAASDSGGNALLDIRPRLRAAAASGDAVSFGATVYASMRLSGEVPQVPIVGGGRSTGLEIELEEAY